MPTWNHHRICWMEKKDCVTGWLGIISHPTWNMPTENERFVSDLPLEWGLTFCQLFACQRLTDFLILPTSQLDRQDSFKTWDARWWKTTLEATLQLARKMTETVSAVANPPADLVDLVGLNMPEHPNIIEPQAIFSKKNHLQPSQNAQLDIPTSPQKPRHGKDRETDIK